MSWAELGGLAGRWVGGMVEMRFKVAVCLDAVYFIEGRRRCLGA